MPGRLGSFKLPIPDALDPLESPRDILSESARIQVASCAMKDVYCAEACTAENRPSINYAIDGFNRRQYWSWALLSDFSINGDSFLWHGTFDRNRIAEYLIDEKLVAISASEVSHSSHNFIRDNQYRFCTPYGDLESVSKYFPCWNWSYDYVVTGNVSCLEDTESLFVPISKRASPETNFGLRLKDSKPIFAYRANDNPICFAESLLVGSETALKNCLSASNDYFGLSLRCFDFWVKHDTNELTVNDKIRLIEMAFKATSATLVKSGCMPALFYELATPEYLQFISSGRISDNRFNGIRESDDFWKRGRVVTSYGEYYFKSIGIDYVDEILSRIPDDVDSAFSHCINELASLKQIKRVSRKVKCMDQSVENRLSIAKRFIQSAYERCKNLDIKAPRSSFSRAAIECWMSIHGNVLAEMILMYQKTEESPFFHVDHIIPLAALPDDYISDIHSPAWHPSNLSLLPEEDNIAKNSSFNGQLIRRKSITREIQNEAVSALLARYLNSL
jgi:hypothetical protein